MPRIEDVATPHGPARVHWHPAAAETATAGLLVLGPGASGSIQAPDLETTAQVATELGWQVALVEPPYRVAGRRVPPRGPSVDEAWLVVVAHAHAAVPEGPLIVGGRSFGSRVAARTAHTAGADGVLCLAYPLHPPGKPERSRLPELDAAHPLPVLAVAGARDPFGRPESDGNRSVVVVPGDHSLKASRPAVREAVCAWLSERANAAP